MNCVLCSKRLTRRWPWLWMGGQPAHLTCIARLPAVIDWESVARVVHNAWAPALRRSLFASNAFFHRLRRRRTKVSGGRPIIVPLRWLAR